MSHLNEVYKIICNVSKIMLYSHKTLRGRKINTKQYLIPKFQAVRNNVQSFLNLQTHVYIKIFLTFSSPIGYMFVVKMEIGYYRVIYYSVLVRLYTGCPGVTKCLMLETMFKILFDYYKHLFKVQCHYGSLTLIFDFMKWFYLIL